MGSNIHIHNVDPIKPLAKFPAAFDTNCATLPRFIGSREFMDAMRDIKLSLTGCDLKGEECNCYPCCNLYLSRPTDFNTLRERTRDLQSVFQLLIDYLESEPNAWIEYD